MLIKCQVVVFEECIFWSDDGSSILLYAELQLF